MGAGAPPAPLGFSLGLLLLLGLARAGGAYKPVIVVHGLFDSPADFQHLLGFINEVSVSRTPGISGLGW